jgi:23S rRNA G2069 N7-methylase RlmK/C1962 C5-methylase RlmI
MALGVPRKLLTAPWCAERILWDQSGILVVDKPAGIPVHGGREELRESVVDRLADYLGPDSGAYLGVHSRLDLGTSGALLFTTRPERNRDVRAAFESGTLRRKYLGIAERRSQCQLKVSGSIRVSLEHDGVRSRVVRDGKLAVTHYRVLEQVGERCLVEFELETGRTHQIRASMAHFGAPLLGDTLYGGSWAPRVCLHAHQLEGAPLCEPIRAPLPSEFHELLQFGALPVCHLENIGRRVRDASLFRSPLLTQRESVRLIDDVFDLLPGVVVDVHGDWFVLRGTAEFGEALQLEVEKHLQALGLSKLEEASGDAARYLAVDEFGVRQVIDLGRLPGAGFSLELAELRRRIRLLPPPSRVLDLFSSGGSLSRGVAQNGAATVCVDISRAAILQARAGAECLGGGPPETRLEFWQTDVRSYLSKAQKKDEEFDLVLLDPPAKSTKQKPTLRIPDDYESLVKGVLPILADTATLIFVFRHSSKLHSTGRVWLETLVGRAGFILEKSEVVGASLDFRGGASTATSVLQVRRQRARL